MSTSTVTLTHVGGPTTLIEVTGWRILTDPTFDPPGRTYRFGWGTSSTKTTGPAVDVRDLGAIDAVLLTHDHHADNLDDAGRALLADVPTVLTTTAGARRLAGTAAGLTPWATTELRAPGRPTIEVTATPCRHGPPGSRRIVGDVIGFALTWPGQRHGAVWVSGDTVLYGGVRDVARRVRVGTAILHLGRVRFPITGRISYSMSSGDAVELASQLRPRTTFPVHFDGWSHFHEGRAAVERAFAAAPPGSLGRVLWPTSGVPQEVEV